MYTCTINLQKYVDMDLHFAFRMNIISKCRKVNCNMGENDTPIYTKCGLTTCVSNIIQLSKRRRNMQHNRLCLNLHISVVVDLVADN